MSIRTEEVKRSTDQQAMPTKGLAQRKCACGAASGLGGSCASCKDSEVAVPERSSMSGSPSSGLDVAERSRAREDSELANQSGSGHDFGRIPVGQPRSLSRISMKVSQTSSPR